MRSKLAIGIFIFFIISWVLRNYFIDDNPLLYWPFAFYCLLSLFGGLIGISIANEWGGLKSAVGKAIFILSLGLLGQFFGQMYYFVSFDILGNTEPLPIGEIGFLGSVILYAIGAFYLAKVAGSKVALKSTLGKVLVILVPIALYAFAYFAFIKDLQPDFSVITFDSVTAILSFVYPLVHATFISLAILAYLLSRKVLGGKLGPIIIGVIIALLIHYFAESWYLYQSKQETFIPGGTTDLAFLVAYFAMTMALIQFKTAFNKLRDGK